MRDEVCTKCGCIIDPEMRVFSPAVDVQSGHLDVVFDSFPGPEGCRFVECEDRTRKSVNAGEWLKRDDGSVVLRITRLPA